MGRLIVEVLRMIASLNREILAVTALTSTGGLSFPGKLIVNNATSWATG